MTDIVERLRNTVQILATTQMNLSMEDWDKVSNAVLDAAGAIKRLRGDVGNAAGEITRLRAENERLRAALERINVGEGWAALIARAALTAQPAPSGWRPIETAPREPGKYLLGWNGHHCGVIQYWERKYEEDPEWVDEHTEFIDPPISHWMPLPPAPGKEEA